MSLRYAGFVWLVALAPWAATPQQVADMTFAPRVSPAAFREGEGPRVAIDEAHFNFHTADGRYAPFTALLRRDGFSVAPLRETFSRNALANVDVLVIANALNERNVEGWALPTPSAFAADEIAAVRAWVEQGGGALQAASRGLQLERRAEVDDRRIVAARQEPIAERGPRSLPPRLELLERHFLVVVELIGREHNRAVVGHDDVVREDHLIEPVERINADRAGEAAREAELLGHFAQHCGFGMLAALEKAGDEPIPARRTADAVHEHDAARAFDDRGDDGHGIAPLNEAAFGTG
jgi:hypothetical protein